MPATSETLQQPNTHKTAVGEGQDTALQAGMTAGGSSRILYASTKAVRIDRRSSEARAGA
jgi:hypothetical protein